MDTNRATAEFIAIQDQVIRPGANFRVIAFFEMFQVFFHNRGKRVVLALPALFLFIIFEHREVDHPGKSEFVLVLAIAQVRLVGIVLLHRLRVGHARERDRDIDPLNLFKDSLEQPLGQVKDIFLGHKGHLNIQLGEFRLAVRAQVLIAETFDDLVIPVHPGNHQYLFKKLRRLRQGEEFARVQTGGNQKSRAPSGVDFVKTGVSTSIKPWPFMNVRIAQQSLCRVSRD